MDHGIAKGDITMSDGTGTDNMTCIIVQFRDPDDVKKELEASASEVKGEESKLPNWLINISTALQDIEQKSI